MPRVPDSPRPSASGGGAVKAFRPVALAVTLRRAQSVSRHPDSLPRIDKWRTRTGEQETGRIFKVEWHQCGLLFSCPPAPPGTTGCLHVRKLSGLCCRRRRPSHSGWFGSATGPSGVWKSAGTRPLLKRHGGGGVCHPNRKTGHAKERGRRVQSEHARKVDGHDLPGLRQLRRRNDSLLPPPAVRPRQVRRTVSGRP
jgi:hypothetical protein